MDVTLRRNEAENSIILQFSEKPSRDILNQLGRKGLGFRWHNREQYWSAKETPERLAFARLLTGQKDLPPGPKSETYRYYSTQRPVDLGTYPKAGGAMIGFENFDSRQSVEGGAFIAWGWLDYSRPLTKKEQADYELRPAPSTQDRINAVPEPVWSDQSRASDQPDSSDSKRPNAFAECYDKVGDDIKILDSSDLSLSSFRAAYFKDLNLFVQSTGCGDCLTVLSLEHAGRAGKVCQEWKFSIPTWPQDHVCSKLSHEHGIHTVRDLWEKCLGNQAHRTNFMLHAEGIRLSNYQQKASSVFSPFTEVKPLTSVPEKWTKANVTRAFLSGQIYCGEVRRHFSDDYGPDSSGCRLNMPEEARDAVEGWGSSSSVRTVGEPDERGVYTLSYSDGPNTYKTLWFDLKCDIAEGKRREEVRAAGVRQFNAMLKASCIRPDPKEIDPGRIYQIQSLGYHDNSGVLSAQEERIQGHLLRTRLEEDYAGDLLSITEQEIQLDRLYQISSAIHRPSTQLTEDPRVIPCGNWQSLVTGKALLELTAEGAYVPMLQEAKDEFSTVERALTTLDQFSRGSRWYAVSNLNGEEYALSAERLKQEVERAKQVPSLDSMLQCAEGKKQSVPAESRDKILSFPSRT